MQRTKANGKSSTLEQVPCGVPQGSVLGPLLFLIYINDVQDVIKNSNYYMYADDLAIVTSGADVHRIQQILQLDTSAVGTWCQENKLTINTDKTYVMWTYPRTAPPDLSDVGIVLGGKTLNVVHQFNYLGVLLDRYMSLAPQCNKVINLVKVRKAQLRRVRRRTDKETSLLVYKLMVIPIMEYCAIWLMVAPPGHPTNFKSYKMTACESVSRSRIPETFM